MSPELTKLVLHKLEPPENKVLFKHNPELNEIWEIPSLQREARESYEEWGDRFYPGESIGEIFSITEDELPIGIIGWFEFGEFSDVLRLRYYGIVPSRRGKRYGKKAVTLILEHLAQYAPGHCVFLAESVSLLRPSSPNIIVHFKSMGFKEFYDPHYGSNAGCGETRSLKIRIPGR